MRLPSDNTLRVLGFTGLAVGALGMGLAWTWPRLALAVYTSGAVLALASLGVLGLRPGPAPLPPGDALLDRALTRRAKRHLKRFRGEPPRPHREDSHA